MSLNCRNYGQLAYDWSGRYLIYRMGLNTFPLLDGMMKEFVLDQMKKGTYKEIPYSTNGTDLFMNLLKRIMMEEEEKEF